MILNYNTIMRKILLSLFLVLFAFTCTTMPTEASINSTKSYKAEQKQLNKQNIKAIKDLFAKHTEKANAHDLDGLKTFYADNYINSDGFNKEAYFKSIASTWKDCADISYTTKIISIDISGDYASVNVEETATGTVFENIDGISIAGEIHSKSQGIYHLTNINSKWYISAETAVTDESSLLYGDARFMDIDIQAPSQVFSGDEYTATVKVDADKNTFIVGSIDRDPVTYPTTAPKSELRALNPEHSLERVLKANTDNINEYAVASLAISKVENGSVAESYRIYMAGLACVMKRINVIPKNNFIKVEEDNK